jgi:hypothetical protein
MWRSNLTSNLWLQPITCDYIDKALQKCRDLQTYGFRVRSFGGPGAFGAEDTPVPIPNTEVKLCCGDDTPCGESSTVPD